LKKRSFFIRPSAAITVRRTVLVSLDMMVVVSGSGKRGKGESYRNRRRAGSFWMRRRGDKKRMIKSKEQ
jgi:hypothetical protein